MNPPDPTPERDPGPPPAPPPLPAAVKSRAFGCLILVIGAAMLGVIPLFGVMPKKVLGALLAFGTVGLMMGAGMVLFPWTEEMFALNQQDDFRKLYRAMPPVWKVWFPLSLVVMLAVMFAALILA